MSFCSLSVGSAFAHHYVVDHCKDTVGEGEIDILAVHNVRNQLWQHQRDSYKQNAIVKIELDIYVTGNM